MGKAAVIFCSACTDIDPRYNEAAREVVRSLNAAGYSIVSGGTTKGMMKVVADEALALGVRSVGIVPRFMEDVCYPDLSELVWTDLMSERKDKMRECGPDLALALPGGVGTMDELFETLTLAKLGKYHGKVVAYNCFGFYDPLCKLLDHMVGQGMLDLRSRSLISFPENITELKALF